MGRDLAELPADGVPVLAYGSNRCPSKITWLRRALGLAGPVHVLAARTTGLAAVWAWGFRERDGSRPATLAARPGHVETHAVWWASPEQLTVLDVCEGRGVRYERHALPPGLVDTTELGPLEPLVYLGFSPDRMPLLVGGDTVLVAEVDQARARTLTGDPAPDDGLPRRPG
ncbi:gamma-glutamylcyclotransferase [Rhodococcus aerolatus]